MSVLLIVSLKMQHQVAACAITLPSVATEMVTHDILLTSMGRTFAMTKNCVQTYSIVLRLLNT